MSSCFKFVFLVLVLVGWQHTLRAQNVSARLDSTSMQIGRQTTLRLFVNVGKSVPVKFPAVKDLLPANIELLNTRTDTIVESGAGASKAGHTIRRNYLITSFDSGSYVIPAIKILVGKDTLGTQPLALAVNTVKVDTTKAVYDIKQPLTVKYTFVDWLRDNWLWLAIGLLIIAIAVGIIIYLKKRPKQVAVIETPKPLTPPHIVAVKKLNQLRDKKLWQMDLFKEYHSELTDIVREYIEARFSISTFEKTTDEIMSGLRHTRISDTDRQRLQNLFMLADLVKFAKERPIADDNEQSLTDALAFVESTAKQTTTEGGPANGVA